MNFYPKFFFLTCGAFIVIIFMITQSKDEEVGEAETIDPLVKHILLHEVPEWMTKVPLDRPKGKCIVTHNPKYLPKIEMFDAVLFSGQNHRRVGWSFPKVRSPHQFYVKELYNLTMTYRRDSDIYWPYGFISDRNLTYLSAADEPNWRKPVFDDQIDPELKENIRRKNKTAAWFVSNCNAESNRTDLNRIMQTIIDVDVYGKCGSLECPRDKKDNCYRLVEQHYFFYFSFENSLCRDYITEKVFNIMSYDVVPVVYGGANYSQHLPPHSYIDANDFATATDLAKYLKSLTRNPKEYVKYFWWKKYYKTVVRRVFDNLCDKLYELQNDKKSIENIKSWWETNQCKNSRKIRFI
ncbi:alpha-(1,3)-fucosyltransferase C-like isoform X2 [Lutzomyia longipalpis]|uniref:alpha-(1,3)-fucosyltransferase C-like isoform X2 n=1 Tax=Lutzomyia longipalpis TaxID=7200 RepID=UPI002483910C|nr:alpha-(1,3)-fucosyltransferase C-like isoform X2 [Lutzomyia longipalpis]